MLKTSDVFGVSPSILAQSYVDRSKLDSQISTYLGRKQHIALKGSSKTGKSWLRKKCISEEKSLVVQCRLGMQKEDIFKDALSQLGINFTSEISSKGTIKGKVQASSQVGLGLIVKVKALFGIETATEESIKGKPVGQDITNLQFIALLIRESEKKLIIEDFHYLSLQERSIFAHDLKAFWDWGLFVMIVGVWSRNDLLTSLNPDLTGRIKEFSVEWKKEELEQVIEKGATALNLRFSKNLVDLFITDSYQNVGLLQSLILDYLDASSITEQQKSMITVSDESVFEKVAKEVARGLDTFYQTFAKKVSFGVRKRNNSTGIYAYAMQSIVQASDDELEKGFSLDKIYEACSKQQSRILKGNLRVVLEKIEELQIPEKAEEPSADRNEQGLVLSFDEKEDEVRIVDKRFLFYRKYLSIKWPWEEIIESSRILPDENPSIIELAPAENPRKT